MMKTTFFFLFSLFVVNIFCFDCPCSNVTLCKPLEISTDRNEVFVFGWDNIEYYNFDVLTTVVLSNPNVTGENYCKMHENNVRIIYDATVPEAAFTNSTLRNQWIESIYDTVTEYGLDGYNFDYEGVIEANSPEVNGFTALVNETTKYFHQRMPYSLITVDVAWSPNCIDGRCYDYLGLAQSSDYLFIMAYDLRSQVKGNGPCIAGSNDALSGVIEGIKDYINLGIAPNQLILGVPWYGYNYTCINPQNSTICPIEEVPFRGVNCSDAAGRTIQYYQIIENILEYNISPIFDIESKTKYFTHSYQNQTYQIWYDDTQTLSYKYEAAKRLKLHGCGVWNADFLFRTNDSFFNNAMWEAFRLCF